MASQWSDDELKERLAKVPSKDRQEAWLRVARRPYTREEEDEARRELVQLLDRMEMNLKQHAWLVGDAYSLADIGVVPFVKRIDEEIAPDEVSDKKHPRVLAWWQAVQARPAFAEAKIGPFVD
jgi:glutathione S-transferase